VTGDQRPDPDELLALAQREEAKEKRGKLKVFFGATAGVGKTFAMLEAAQERRRRGEEVVVGWVDTHGRAETEALLAGLERIAPRTVEHRGVALRDLDLDAALARRPALLLVDELAHTNAPGCRHAKRWQDVEELLANGIDVWTTLNVQHVDSLNDLVGKITGVLVRETVPDSVLEGADQVELVDLPPEKLLERLRDGKVYVAEATAARAVESFFRPGNLIALRELALRKTAERVEAQMQHYRELHGVTEVWPAGERVLVAVSSGPAGARLVRAAKRLAERLRAEWWVAYVETPHELRLPEEVRNQAWETLRLAERLGAKTLVLAGERPDEEILEYARRRNVTKIVVGKPLHPRWRDWFGSTLHSRLARSSGDIDLYVIAGEAGEVPRPPRAASSRERTVRGLLAAVLVTLAATGLCALLFPRFSEANLVMVYLLGVVGVASWCGRRAAALASVLAVAAFDFFFVEPHLTFAVADTQYVVTFAVMLGTALLISTLTARLRHQAEAARQREARSAALFDMARDLTAAHDETAIAEAAARHVREVFVSQVLLLLPDRDRPGRLRLAAEETITYRFDEREEAVAQWVFDHARMAGKSTDTLPAAKGLYLPLKTAGGVVGVLGVHPADPEMLLSPEQLHFLEAFANQVALAIE
jgi:two-component system sensor histidine kinase KdpD